MTYTPEVVRGPDRGDGLKPSSPGNSWVDEQGKWSKQLKDTAASSKDLGEQGLENVESAASWQIPGMESMSSDEYYAAINKRVAAAKAARRASGEAVGSRSRDLYEESLNSRNHEVHSTMKSKDYSPNH